MTRRRTAATETLSPDQLAVEVVPLASLTPWPGNPRTHDLAMIRESLRLHGQYRPLVAQAGTRRIMAGNGTWEAARDEGWSEIAATFVEVDDERAARIVAVDNRASDRGGYDEPALAALLRSLPDLGGTGYTDADLAALLRRVEPPPGGDDEAQLGHEFVLVVTCRDEMHQTELLERFVAEGLECRAVVT